MGSENLTGPDGETGDDVSPVELLYDGYLEAMLSGAPEDPSSYCARHGVTDSILQARLEELWRMASTSHETFLLERTVLVDAKVPEPARRTAPGERLGGYVLLEILGDGGMGVVYRAHQESLRRDVAVKVMTANLQTSASALERFEREARALARLQHPSIVRVYENGDCDGVRYLVMELVDGEGLDRILRRGREREERLLASRVVKWFAQLARALESAHEAGIIHRDLKPSNVLIRKDDTPVLIDFGLARDQEASAITRTETFLGSPAYAAPEQILAQRSEMDERTDVYSLGASLYECLCGCPPFAGETIEQVFHRALLDEPAPLRERNKSISSDLETVTLKALEKQPENRFQSARELAEDLEALLEFRPIRARPPSFARRCTAWARRRPGLFGGALTGLVAIVVLVVVVAWGTHAEAAERVRRAASLVAEADRQLAQMTEDRRQSSEMEQELRTLEQDIQSRYVPPEGYERLQHESERTRRRAQERVDAYYRIQGLLTRAQRLDPQLEGLETLLARLHLEEFDEALAVSDDISMASHRRAIRDLDPEGRHEQHLTGVGALDILTDPPGATVHLFAQREQATIVSGGEERLVPVPWQDGGVSAAGLPVRPGTWMLEVREPLGNLRRGDLIVDLEGVPIEGAVYMLRDGISGAAGDRVLEANGKPVSSPWHARTAGGISEQERRRAVRQYRYRLERDGERIEVDVVNPNRLAVGTAADLLRTCDSRGQVYRDGKLLELELPAGLVTRITTTPLLRRASATVGTTPLRDVTVPPGELLLVVELEGHETQRVICVMDWNDKRTLEIPLVPVGTSPPGFVPILMQQEKPVRRLWMAEQEVTMADWLEFLADPDVRARIDSATSVILVPRGSSKPGDWLFDREPDGTFSLSEREQGISPSWPVLGISWDDAVAYASWRTERARAAGKPYRFALPTRSEWLNAAGGHRRRYVHGHHFRPRWTKCCYAREFADPEPVLSFPVDESPLGVRDVGGSAWEWLGGWWEERKGHRRAVGGAWGQGSRESLGLWGGFGAPPTWTSGETGMRLALHIDR